MSVLADYLKSKTDQVRAAAERRKTELADWQRAMQDLVNRMIDWLHQADVGRVLKYRQTDHTFEDYDQFKHVVKGLQISLGDSVVRVNPSDLRVVGAIQIPGESTRRRVDGLVQFDNGTERVSLYRVKIDGEDRWFWWTHGGIGQPLDRESFEGTVVGLLQ